MSSPKLLFIDIETSPIIGAVWTMFDANVIWTEREQYIMCFAARWGLEGKTKVYALPDYKRYKRERHNDRSLCKDLFRHLDEADVIVAHNGDRFDLRKINARLLVHKLPPPSPYKTIDTLKISRSKFGFPSNKLDNLANATGLGRKLPHTGAKLWQDCCNGDKAAWRLMREYNAHDVDLLTDYYDTIKAWAPNHPDLRLYDNRPGCPVCRSNRVIRRGFNIAMKRKTERLQCSDCSHWFTGQVIKAEAA